jgi:hypothetical protein
MQSRVVGSLDTNDLATRRLQKKADRLIGQFRLEPNLYLDIQGTLQYRQSDGASRIRGKLTSTDTREDLRKAQA